MPRFFFHFRDGDELPDELGLELPNLAAARLEAIRGIRSLISDGARQGRLPVSKRVHIVDEKGRLLLAVPFNEAILIE